MKRAIALADGSIPVACPFKAARFCLRPVLAHYGLPTMACWLRAWCVPLRAFLLLLPPLSLLILLKFCLMLM